MPYLSDQEDVDVKAKNVHIDLSPHEHDDVYEAPANPFGAGQPEPVPNDEGLGEAEDSFASQAEDFLASAHSNIGESASGPWGALWRLCEAGQLAEVEHEFQDYEGPVHPHLQKARDTLRQGLGWTVDQIRKAVPNLDQFKGGITGKAGTGGFHELSTLVQQLEQVPDMPSDQVMQRLQTVSNGLHKLKNSLKKNPGADPEQDAMAKGVEQALQAIPSVMKSAGTLAKSSGTDKGLWQQKMTGRFADAPKGFEGRPNASDTPLGAGFRPNKIITHPTGQDPKMPLSKAEKERQAQQAKASAVHQRVQPTVRKAGEKEPPKGPVKPGPKKEKEPEKKESAWDGLAALLG